MITPLLQTKLYIPSLRPELIPRLHLIERLNEGLHHKLTLISAPAGFGKTTLVSSWIYDLRFTSDDLRLDATKERQIENPKSKIQNQVAWFSLDEADNALTRFLTYFIAALQTIEASIGQGALDMLQAPQPPPDESLLSLLLNEIAAIPSHFTLVLDDYHVIKTQTQSIHNALTFLLDHLPPQMHLVIASRADPPWPLARLRARGEMIELRTEDLRFTPAEVAAFLNNVMGLTLSPEDVAALSARTEGWIAGLRLAAISMQGRDDVSGFVRTFAGSNRFILDYLMEEVLERQPPAIRDFLLRTSVLERLSGPLCDAVCSVGTASSSCGTAVLGKEAEEQGNKEEVGEDSPLLPHSPAPLPPHPLASGQEVLEHLEHTNLFIIPLDDERCWYRYHHLFADLLRHRLHQTHLACVPVLHRRASCWFEQQGSIAEAIDHALLVTDYERAERLISQIAEGMWQRGEQGVLLKWVNDLPKDRRCAEPRLYAVLAVAVFWDGRFDEAEAYLRAAEKIEEAHPEDKLRGILAAIRAHIADYRGDIEQTVKHARLALATLTDDYALWRSLSSMAMGDVNVQKGPLKAATEAYKEAIRTGHLAGNSYCTSIAQSRLVVMYQRRGRLRQAVQLIEQYTSETERGYRQSGAIYLFSGELLYEENKLDQALEQVTKGLQLCEQQHHAAAIPYTHMILARIRLAQGDEQGAWQATEESIRQLNQLDVPPWVESFVIAWRARFYIINGELDAAGEILNQRNLPLPGVFSYPNESEYIVLARRLVAKGKFEAALQLLKQLHDWLVSIDWLNLALEVKLVWALTLQRQERTAEALKILSAAFDDAGPETYLRMFIDEGEPMFELLQQAIRGGISPDYASKLLAAFQAEQQESAAPFAESSPAPPLLIEPLSERELEVLCLIAEGLSNQEIAQQLVITLRTVKWHTGNIYGKLGVKNRTQAVAKAREQGLLSNI